MKQTKLTKKILLLFIAVVLVACMTMTFVACNNGGDDEEDFDGTFSISTDAVDSAATAKFNEALTGMMGYLCSHGEEYESIQVGGNIFTSDDYVNVEGMLYVISIYATCEEDDDNGLECILYIFKTAQDANAYYATEVEEYEDNRISKDGNVVLVESEEGLYNTIKNSTIPTEAKTQSILGFFNSSLKKEVNANNNYVGLSIAAYSSNVDIVNVYGVPTVGNISRQYSYYSAEYVAEIVEEGEDEEDFFNLDLSQYSSDSYVKKQSDGSYKYYLKNKLGFTFEENEDKTEYIITGYYYNEAPATLVLPSTYNNKPVVGVEHLLFPDETTAITIPSSITSLRYTSFRYAENLKTINYQGTKAQWNALGVINQDLENIEVIHCTDGDINPND
ncbi:MAG: hypothetical protein NC037_05660 [Bacteroides sp.]|nr:hypothetical protein [Bacillota bacterium]MCM1394237.1 hypothetical protein [[Eubacterium] siraeum]MCM1455992.1 hypothetical protein [Bacteroides sp.]